jgi:hypothetical protein
LAAGNFSAIVQTAADLIDDDPDCLPMIQRLIDCAEQFDDEGIIELLMEHDREYAAVAGSNVGKEQ